MKSKLLYVLAIIFLMGWGIGFFVVGLGIVIHLLLFAAVLTIIIKLITE